MSTTVMGIVNVTPDSFSDGGHHADPADAEAHARRLVEHGAAMLDVGGESTRPGSRPVAEAVELDRVVPVVERLAALDAVRAGAVEISVDTTKAAVAEAAVAAGATVVNDVSARLEEVAAGVGAGWVAMHSPGPSATMQDDPRYDDVVAEVEAALADAAARGRAAGVTRLWVDPGFGFGKSLEHNLELLAHIDRFGAVAPVLVGVSRKRTIGELHARSDGLDGTAAVDVGDRLEGSLAAAVWAAALGVDVVRVHDVRATVHALTVAGADRRDVVALP